MAEKTKKKGRKIISKNPVAIWFFYKNKDTKFTAIYKM